MTATAASPAAPTSQVPVRPVSFVGALRAEWIKFRSLRSTVWTVLITALLMVGFALMMASLLNTASTEPEMQEGMSSDPGLQALGLTGTTAVTLGYSFAQLAVAVLAALTVTNEYSTGMIRATFSAVPHRLPALWAKLVVVVVATVVVISLALGVAVLVTMPILDSAGLPVDLSDADQVRALVGCVLYLATVAAFSLAVGALLRHTAGAIFTLVALFFVLPIIFQIVVSASDAVWAEWVNKLLPSVAGERIISTGVTPPTLLEPWVGYGVLAGYTVALLVAAGVAWRRRDA
ncbi:ABC transporter permease subunit [Isoptericola sediminis]|uniref:ABC transporter permease subunit n=1 Tax=Isoptericola sediminis TaxID=2733572 RepID=A0A849K8G8_9MICO|nr:ABC transporter permease subunit [Isoptericola sediminis]NNU27477.1 ABC transporter permease subunit [Isoptericola sediminis]